jgi:hypothetical protein
MDSGHAADRSFIPDDLWEGDAVQVSFTPRFVRCAICPPGSRQDRLISTSGSVVSVLHAELPQRTQN